MLKLFVLLLFVVISRSEDLCEVAVIAVKKHRESKIGIESPQVTVQHAVGMKVSIEELERMQLLSVDQVRSLDSPEGFSDPSDESRNGYSFYPQRIHPAPESIIERRQSGKLIEAILSDVLKTYTKETSRKIVTDIFYNRILSDSPDTQDTVAARHQISRQAIQKAEKRLIERLKAIVEDSPHYMDALF